MIFGMVIISLILLPKIGLIDLSVIPLGIYSLFIILKFKKFILTKDIIIILVLWLMLFLLALLSLNYYGNISYEILFKPIRQIVIIVCLSSILMKLDYTVDDILKLVLVAASINSIVIILQYLLEMLNITNNFLIMPSFDENFRVAFRKPGLYSGYPPAGMMAIIGITISLYFVKKNIKVIFIVTFILSTAALMLTSRMALLIGLLYMFILIPYVSFPKKKNFYMMSSVIILLIFVVYVLIAGKVLHHDTINVMFELFLNIINGDGIQTNSSTALIDSYLDNIPIYVSTILLGNGLTIKSDLGLTIDSGIHVVLFGGGLIALYLYIVQYFLYLRIAINSIFNNFSLVVLYLLLFLLVFVSNTKGAYLFGRGPGDVILLLVISAHIYRHKKEVKCKTMLTH